MATKVPKFPGASANGFWYRLEKPQGSIRPPPTSNRVKRDDWHLPVSLPGPTLHAVPAGPPASDISLPQAGVRLNFRPTGLAAGL